MNGTPIEELVPLTTAKQKNLINLKKGIRDLLEQFEEGAIYSVDCSWLNVTTTSQSPMRAHISKKRVPCGPSNFAELVDWIRGLGHTVVVGKGRNIELTINPSEDVSKDK